MKHQLPNLPWQKNALAPSISEETIDFHYGKHHKAYVDKLNALIVGTEFEEASLEDIIRRATGPIFNNGAQVWNHTFFWNSLTPRKHEAQGMLLDAIDQSFGSLTSMKEKFEAAATGQFGSGWAWLVLDQNGKLAVESTPNAENPLKRGKTPLLTCDVWEHAYYIDYRNERAKFVAAFWHLCNWDFALQNLERARDSAAA